MMRILADLHHFDLFFSLQLLFEQRLGWELYRPIGYDWYKAGCWLLSEEPTVRTGYLSTESGGCHSALLPYWKNRDPSWARFSTELLRIGAVTSIDKETYRIYDESKPGVTQKGITFEGFKQTSFDFILSSVPQHFRPFERLRNSFQPQAKHIFYAGNANWPLPEGVQNLMANTLPSGGDSLNHVVCHQEFDLSIFFYQSTCDPLWRAPTVHSYVHFPESERLWVQVMTAEAGTPSLWTLVWVGGTLAPLGQTIVQSSCLARHMREPLFIWHIKPGGEGFGHILHNAFAVGRPVIINKADYRGMQGEALLTDDITCVDVNGKTPKEIQQQLLRIVETPGRWLEMSQAVRGRFESIVNYDTEEQQIRAFLERCS